jgi:DNA gyrase subunit A
MSGSFFKNDENSGNIIPVSIVKEMQSSFLDYSMSVIVSRALPDVRDGLKPVHRRVLYTMHILKNTPGAAYKKSARIVGDTMGRFHPHGDSSIYQALVRLSQPFSMRYPMVDGQGNFGSIDGDSAAAMRYTEVRMAKMAMEMLRDIDKETVDFIPNYDDQEMEPSVLPTKVPNLLINGASGIAVGMATNIAPHNLSEIIEALFILLNDKEADLLQLMSVVKGPDFPTGGVIYGRDGIYNAFKTGRGKVKVRARIDIEDLPNDREALIVTEIPYQVNKSMLVSKIADLVKNKLIEGISDIRDESDKSGMRIVIFLKRDAMSEIVLNKLYKMTQLQNTFSVNNIAIVDGRPMLMNLKTLLTKFLEHRRQVILRRTEYQLNEASKRREIVEGLGVASLNITEVIALIRESSTPLEAQEKLMKFNFTGYGPFLEKAGLSDEEVAQAINPYKLSERQTKAILEMRLHRLTGLQQEKLGTEYKDLRELISKLLALLQSEELLTQEIINELTEIKEKYGDERRTEIVESSGDITVEDLIEDEAMVITLTKSGYIKSTQALNFKAQKRGGRGKKGAKTRDDEDIVVNVIAASALKTILFFTNTGRVFKNKAYRLPKGGPNSRGKAIINVLGLQNDEKVVAMLPVPDMEAAFNILFATKMGIVKKTPISLFANINQNGIIAIKIDEGDHLINARITDGNQDVLLATTEGLVTRFPESNVRATGRSTRGVKGIRLRGANRVVELGILDPADEEVTILSVSERGFGKRSRASEYTPHHRGGKGLISIKTSERNGNMVSCMVVRNDDEIFVLTEKGTLIRLEVGKISLVSRNTLGVTLMKLPEGDRIIDITLLPKDESDDENSEDDNFEDDNVDSSQANVSDSSEVNVLDSTEEKPVDEVIQETKSTDQPAMKTDEITPEDENK